MAAKPKKGGRPTKYRAAYCKQVVEYLKGGFSLVAFAGTIGVCEATIHQWQREHDEFSESVKRGQAAAVAFWEALNIENAQTGKGSATSIIFGLKNRAPSAWKDISRSELSGPNGGAIEIGSPSELTDAQLAAIATRGSEGAP